MPTLFHWIVEYGYIAVFIGCLLEGEMLLLLAGVAAHEGKLSLPLVIMLAFVAGTLGDQILFWIGRRAGQPLLNRWSGKAAQIQRVNRLLKRFDASLIFGIRFMYGLRLIGPLIIGASDVAPRRFALFNVLGAAVWAPLIAMAGYLFGHMLAPWMSALDGGAIVAVLVVAVILAAIHHWHRARRTEPAPLHIEGPKPAAPVGSP